MSKTYRTAVVVVPPQVMWASIQAIRQQHDRHFRRWMPHITLLYPFWPREEWDSILEPLARSCQAIEPFEIALSEVHTFRHHSSYTLWLVPEPKALLVELQTALWRSVPDCDDTRRHPHGFTPHLSIGQASGRTAAERLLDELRATWKPTQVPVSEVQLIWRGDPPDDAFRVGHRVKLGIAAS
jgi:2'-5' RNA ligase